MNMTSIYEPLCLSLCLSLILGACVADDGTGETGETSSTNGDGDGDGDPSGDGDGDGDPSGDGDGDLPPDACDLVANQSYSSEDELECGIGPNGIVLCNWTISFDGANDSWSYSDIGEGGEYACEGLQLISAPEAQPLGEVSGDGATLTWAGVVYLRDS